MNMDFDTMSGHFMNQAFVETLQECESTCEHMTHHLKMMEEDYRARITQAMLLRDCADICDLTAKYAAKDSIFAKNAASLCAYICVMCGNECARFPDRMSQHCAMVCFNCAKHCTAFAEDKMLH